MLQIENISKTFNPGTITEKHALKGVSLHLPPGDFVTVIGGNGAGKSTLMNSIAGTFRVDTGRISIDGIDITKWDEHQRAKFIGRVFQDPMMGTAADMMIEENLAIASRRGQSPTLRWSSKAEDRDRFRDMLKSLDLGLEDRLESKVGLLSGGQRQALTLLMATIVKPKLLLLDEHARSKNCGEGFESDRKDRHGTKSDDVDDNSQHARRSSSRHAVDNDVRRKNSRRCAW